LEPKHGGFSALENVHGGSEAIGWKELSEIGAGSDDLCVCRRGSKDAPGILSATLCVCEAFDPWLELEVGQKANWVCRAREVKWADDIVNRTWRDRVDIVDLVDTRYGGRHVAYHVEKLI
jgi:hypothetical protein